jgi:hypothetical protein
MLRVVGVFLLILLVVAFTFFDMPGFSRGHYLPRFCVYVLALSFAMWCFRNRSTRMGIAIVVFVILFLVSFGRSMPIGVRHIGLRTTTGMSEMYSGIHNGTLDVSFAGGKILTLLLDGEGYYRADLRGETGAIPSQAIVDDRVYSRLEQPTLVWWANRSIANDWTIEISPRISWDIAMKLSRTDGVVDLSGIPINSCDLTIVNSNLRIQAARSGIVSIKAIASRIVIVVPDDATISVTSDGFLYSDNLSKLGWDVSDGVYVGPGSDMFEMKLQLHSYASSAQLIMRSEVM